MVFREACRSGVARRIGRRVKGLPASATDSSAVQVPWLRRTPNCSRTGCQRGWAPMRITFASASSRQ
jgi:hypothetical protein